MIISDEAWKKILAQRVRGLRLTATEDEDGWSQRYLARVMGVNKSIVQRLEAGYGCSPAQIIKLAMIFRVSTDFLLGHHKVPESDHETVERAREQVQSLASSIETLVRNPRDATINNLSTTYDMLRRSGRGLADLAYRLQYPDPSNLNKRVPYGYARVKRMEARLDEELDEL